jgi:hypothetical protein
MKLASLKTERGVTFVEAVFVFPLVLLLLIVTFDLLRVAYYQLSLHYALINAMRIAQIDPDSRSQVKIWGAIDDKLRGLGIGLCPADDFLTVCPIATFGTTACPTGTVDSPGVHDMVVFEVIKPVDLFLMSGLNFLTRQRIQLRATALGKIEPL